MLVAIERGREPAVDYLNGEIVRRAAALEMAVPINRRVQETIRAIWRGTSRSSIALLRRVYEDSRIDAYAATAAGFPGIEPPANTLTL
jgi:2-dehydropantoate 2-reductase